jgi:hypothetical protein
MVKVIPDSLHIFIINPVIFLKEVESLGLNPSLVKIDVIVLIKRGISFIDIHFVFAKGSLLNNL